MNITLTYHSEKFPDEVIAAAARAILEAQGYKYVWAQEQRAAEQMAIAAMESATELIPRRAVADTLAALRVDVDAHCLKLQCHWKRFDSDKLPEDAYNEATVDCIEKTQKLIDATIAALGLDVKEKE